MRATVKPAIIALALATAAVGSDRFPLRGVEVEGAKLFDEGRIVALTGLKVGSEVEVADFHKATAKLSDAGVFERIEFRYGPKGDGVEVVFKVEEVEQTYPLRLEGFDEPDDELIAMLRETVPLFKERVPATGTMAERIGDALQKRWMARGKDSEIIGRLAPIDAENLAMVFQPDIEMKPIAFVTFEGSEAIPPLDLQRHFNQAAMGEPYSESRILELLHFNVQPLFEEVGRMAVKFCPCETEPDPDSGGLLVKVRVDDGPEYHWGEVSLPDHIPAPVESFEEGERVNMTALRQSQGVFEEALKRNGYLKATTRLEWDKDDEAKTVSAEVTAEPGPLYSFARLNIKGLDILAEPVIRKRWGLKPGDPYNPTYPQFFLDKVEEEQMFDNLGKTSWSQRIDDARRAVEVTLVFHGEREKKEFVPDEPTRSRDPF